MGAHHLLMLGKLPSSSSSSLLRLKGRYHCRHHQATSSLATHHIRNITFNMKGDKIKERTRRNYKEEGDADDRHSSSWPSFSTVVVGCPREYEELSQDKSKMA